MKPPLLIQFRNCQLIRNHQIVIDDLWVRDGKIINPEHIFFDERKQADIQIDCKNSIIAPGFIDLQINGGYGVDFSYDIDTVESGINKVAKTLLMHGVTAFCPTIVTSPQATYQKILPKIPKRVGSKDGATILGVHLEGPFISAEMKGAHPKEFIRNFDKGMEDIEQMYGGLENVQIVTLAPEKKEACQIIKSLTGRGITVSIGHSKASLSDGEMAVKCGARLITHLFNAMLPFHHRDPGLVGLLASQNIPPGQTVYFGIIADGVHTDLAALRIAHRTHPQGLILVTDAISALGLEEGFHHIGQFHMEVRNQKAFLAGSDTLCGSIASMDHCIRIFQKATNCTNVYALEAASLHPAQCLGISHKKGSLEFGADADFVFLDNKLSVLSTWIAGECVYNLHEKNPHLGFSVTEHNISC